MAEEADLDENWEYIQARPDQVNTVYDCGMAPGGRANAVEFLLDHGAHIDHQDDKGLTALHHASMRRREDVVALLLRRGADMGARDRDGCTPLMIAAGTPQGAPIMDLLLQYDGVDVDVVDNDGYITLIYTCRHKSAGIIQGLLEAGADPSWWRRDMVPFLGLPLHFSWYIRHVQPWFRAYTTVKARHLHDAVRDINSRPITIRRFITRNRVLQERVGAAPTCLKGRVRAGGELTKVELRVLQREQVDGVRNRRSKRLRKEGGHNDGGDVRDGDTAEVDSGKRVMGSMVVGHAVGEMSRELFVEMMGWVPITEDTDEA